MDPIRTAPGRPGPDEPDAPSTPVAVRIPDAWLPELVAAAQREGLSRHALLRLLIREGLDRRAT